MRKIIITKVDKIIIVIVLFWTLVNSYFLIKSYDPYFKEIYKQYGKSWVSSKDFFASIRNDSYGLFLSHYDWSEFFLYVGAGWLGFFIYQFLKK